MQLRIASLGIVCADPGGGGGRGEAPPPPPEKSQSYHKPAFHVGQSSARQRNAI